MSQDENKPDANTQKTEQTEQTTAAPQAGNNSTIFDQADVTKDTTRLDDLKAEATMLGVEYRENIGEDTLSERIKAHKAKVERERVERAEAKKATAKANSRSVAPTGVKETAQEATNRKKRDALELIRCRVTCMDPKYAKWDGEFWKVGNAVTGAVTKFIPYDGSIYHIPKIIYNAMRDREFQSFRETRDGNGRITKQTFMAKSFNIEVLPNLTTAELDKLAQRQAMANGTQRD